MTADGHDEPCGCPDRTRHVPPHVHPVLHITHGERDPDKDPAPHVDDNGEAYCLCGHPEYNTCLRESGFGVMDLTLHNVGGYYISTSGRWS